ncbi:hypothetical protein HMPREF0765_0949 [Sphingobacterium spiritivorum ATCC 33300]|uniref:Uncharacterized protein n=1 Tax=Sphingobacterium spiritivorum ATCC 33300 TaxID=525372 RepID=C2FUE3_SPHSI|nr:hypothetical protein [Sphingobacterium spiritivorum]EEI93521.1 hypothetical protein HMPREF0765_0949 [Sphingobacterium spiritivorum ATCC 33300]QQS95861.1 hypothetical protein I6J03_21220 [Sphingobacterium spiritivorum]
MKKGRLKLVSVILALVVLVQPFSRMAVFISFKINQDYISRVLCENRDKPELSCHGQCVLMKKIKKLEEKEHNQDMQIIKQLNELIYTQMTFDWSPAPLIIQATDTRQYITDTPHISSAYALSLFKPPRIS